MREVRDAVVIQFLKRGDSPRTNNLDRKVSGTSLSDETGGLTGSSYFRPTTR